MKNLFGIFCLFSLISCFNESKSVTETHDDLLHAPQNFTEKHKKKKFADCKVQILLPDSYRVDNTDDPTKKLNKAWFDLYKKGSRYYLKKISYKINKGKDECSGMKTKEIETSNYSLLFIDYKYLNSGRIAHLIPSKKVLHPDEKVVLKYYDNEYTITCSAKVKSGIGDRNFDRYTNYKLYLQVNDGEKELIFQQNEYVDTQTTIEFVGDIDGDYKLDFILNSPAWYEENRKILFLSSQAKNKSSIKKVAECSVQHDC